MTRDPRTDARQNVEETLIDPALLYQKSCASGQAPDLAVFLGQIGPLSSLRLCAVIRADQEYRWTHGQNVLAEDYLRRFPVVHANDATALDLIYHEFLLRRRLDHQPTIAEYLGRFPELADRLRTQLEIDQAFGTETISAAGRDSAGPRPPPCAGPGTPPEKGDSSKPTDMSRRIGKYEVLGELGRGTFGVVYRARDSRLGRQVAVKVMHATGISQGDELARFRAEVEALGSLQHPNIVQIHDTGIHEGTPYLVMELIEGGNLAEQLKGQPHPGRDAAALVETLARATHVAHQKGIVHRDLKPANIMLTGDGTPKITDFGLVKRIDRSLKLSQTGQAIGTPSYMAPEQASGKIHEVGPAADVYALGAILYELVTGRPPFQGTDILAVLDQVRFADPLSPSRLVPRLSRDLCTISLKCLEKEPRRRYASALDLADDLRRFLDGHSIVARSVGVLERAWRLLRRRPWQVGLAAAGVLVVVLLVLWWAREWVLEERRHREVAVAKLEAEREKLAVEKEKEIKRFMEREHEYSLEALNGILSLVNGKLQNTPGLEPLHHELLQHYKALIDRQQGSNLAPHEKLVDACRQLGKLISQTGKLSDALRVLDQAKHLSEGLLKDQSRKPHLAHQLARVLQERGLILEEIGLTTEAQQNYETARKLLERLNAEAPHDLEYQRDLGEVLHLLAVLSADADTASGRKEALLLYQRALKLRKALERHTAATPKDSADLARTYGYLGDLLLDMNERANADQAYWQSQHLRERLAKMNGSDDDETQFQLARGYGNFAVFQTRMGVLDSAAYFLNKSLAIRLELTKKKPKVTAYQLDLATAYNNMAELLLLQNLPQARNAEMDWKKEARAYASAAENIYRKQVEQKEGNENAPHIKLGLVQALTLQARLWADDKSTENAFRFLSTAASNADDLVKERKPAEALPRSITAEAHYQHAVINALTAELVKKRPYHTDTKSLIENALKGLGQAYQKGFGRIHSENVRLDRAFHSLRDQPEFKKLLGAQ